MGGGSGRSQRRREREEGFAVFLPSCLRLVYLCIYVFVYLYLCVVYGGGVRGVTTQGEEGFAVFLPPTQFIVEILW